MTLGLLGFMPLSQSETLPVVGAVKSTEISGEVKSQ